MHRLDTMTGFEKEKSVSHRALSLVLNRPVTGMLLALAGLTAQAGGLEAASGRVAPTGTDQFIVHYRGDATAASRSSARREVERQRADRAASRFGVSVSFRRDGADGGRVFRASRALTPAQIEVIGAQMAVEDAEVLSVEPDLVMLPQWVPSDTLFSSQWHYYEAAGGINLPAAWDRATGAGVRVAVIDTGYRPHADLTADVVGGYDLISDTAVSNDGDGRDASALDPGDACSGSSSSWHGTHVAGTIAAVTNNASGVAGVAPGAQVVPVRVLGMCGGYTSDIAAGVIWAAGGTVSGLPANAYPARVLNLSLGGTGACGTTMQGAIDTARALGAVVVVAAGNSNVLASTATPANCSGVIAVGAVTRTGAKASYSNHGATVDVAAPGSAVVSTLNSGTTTPQADSYASYSGTSMATPHVSGVVALMLQKNAALTPDQVEAILKSTARTFPVSPGTTTIGAGIVDAKKAVDTAMGSLPTAITEAESNNTPATAQVISAAHASIAGTMASTTDTDYFRVSVGAGLTLSATLNHALSTQNYQLYLYDAAGTTALASSTRAAGLPETVTVRNATTAVVNYLVRVVYAAGDTGATSGKYVLNLLQQ